MDELLCNHKKASILSIVLYQPPESRRYDDFPINLTDRK